MENEREYILNRLAELDIEMPRPLEDLINWQMKNGYTPYAGQLQIIQQKEELREQLRNFNEVE